MQVTCPECKTIQKAPDDSEGKKARCKSCREVFVILASKAPIVVPNIAEAPIAIDSQHKDPAKPNFLTRTWSQIPAPFKFSFLATLGVVSALLFAWYTIRIPNLLQKKPYGNTSAKTNNTNQLTDTNVGTQGNVDESGKTESLTLVGTDYEYAILLTEVIHCCEDYASLNVFRGQRLYAVASDNALATMYMAKSNVALLSGFIDIIKQRQVFTDSDARICSEQLCRAMQAELDFQRYLVHVASGFRTADAAAARLLMDESARCEELAVETLIILTIRHGVGIHE